MFLLSTEDKCRDFGSVREITITSLYICWTGLGQCYKYFRRAGIVEINSLLEILLLTTISQFTSEKFSPVYTSHILMRPLLRPVASRSWSWPNLKRCHSIFTQRLGFSGTEEPNASPQTMSPQSMACSRGSPGTRALSLPCRDKRLGPEPFSHSSFLTELK